VAGKRKAYCILTFGRVRGGRGVGLRGVGGGGRGGGVRVRVRVHAAVRRLRAAACARAALRAHLPYKPLATFIHVLTNSNFYLTFPIKLRYQFFITNYRISFLQIYLCVVSGINQ
jgi:hypothetical protein